MLAVSCAASRSRTQSAEQTAVSQCIETACVAEGRNWAAQEQFVGEEIVETFETVPAGAVAVEVPLMALDSLPEGARFGARDGRVEVVAVRRGGKLRVEARSDSVARAVVRRVRSAATQHSDSAWARAAESRVAESASRESSAAEVTARRRPVGAWWLVVGFVLCAAFLIRWRK